MTGPHTPPPPPGPGRAARIDRALAVIAHIQYALLSSTALLVICTPAYWTYA